MHKSPIGSIFWAFWLRHGLLLEPCLLEEVIFRQFPSIFTEHIGQILHIFLQVVVFINVIGFNLLEGYREGRTRDRFVTMRQMAILPPCQFLVRLLASSRHQIGFTQRSEGSWAIICNIVNTGLDSIVMAWLQGDLERFLSTFAVLFISSDDGCRQKLIFPFG